MDAAASQGGRGYFGVRVGLAVLGCAAIAWGSVSFAITWPQGQVEQAATHIIDAESYRLPVLRRLRSTAIAVDNAGPCRPSVARSTAIIQLQVAELEANETERGALDSELEQSRAEVLRSLACSPADPFLLMALFWLQTVQYGFNPADLDLLRMSYRLGPNEGWIGLRRFSLALAAINRLPPELVGMMVDDFVHLVGAAIYPLMVDRFVAADLPTRNMLLAALDRLSEFHQRNFAAYLKSRGLEDSVLGVEKREPRPWH
jgi:hypothetical protein